MSMLELGSMQAQWLKAQVWVSESMLELAQESKSVSVLDSSSVQAQWLKAQVWADLIEAWVSEEKSTVPHLSSWPRRRSWASSSALSGWSGLQTRPAPCALYC